jgi:hypothetical protein
VAGDDSDGGLHVYLFQKETLAVKPSDCHAYLERLAARDGFLNTMDQQPQLETLLQALATAIDEALDRHRVELATSDQTLNRELTEVAEGLAGSRKMLSRAFDEIRAGSSPGKGALDHLARTIEARILWLYDRVRLRQEESLNQVPLRKKLWKSAGEDIRDALDDMLRHHPEELTLIRDRLQQHEPKGRSIWQIEAPAFKRTICTGRSRLATRLLFSRRRRRLKQRYLILQPAVREVFARHRPAVLQPGHMPADDDFTRLQEQLRDNCADLWRGLRFHLETAAEDCTRLAAAMARNADDSDAWDQKLAQSQALVTEALQRAEQQVFGLAEPVKELSQKLLQKLDDALRNMLGLIGEDLQRILSWRERLAHKRRRLIKKWRRRCLIPRKSMQALTGLLGNIRQPLLQAVQNLRSGKGPADKSESPQRNIIDLPTPEAILRQAESLPPVCRRLFTAGALQNREFMVGKDKDLDALRELFEHWQEGHLCSIAVTGPDGSGKTSLINCFQSELGDRLPVLRLSIKGRLTSEAQLLEACRQWFDLENPPADFDTVEAHLNSLPRGIVIMENLHNLLLRTVGGLDAIRAFLRLLLASRHRLLWVVTVRQYPWQRMRHLLNVDRYFTHRQQTLFSSEEEICEALMLRTQTSSYPVVFLNGEDSAQASNEKNSQAGLRKRYFSDLFAATRGNMQAAIYYWLMCLEYDEQQKTLRVSPLGKLDYSPLRSLEGPQLYALAEIVAHGGLSIAEHAAIFAGGRLQSRLLLEHLAQLNLLEFPSAEDRYQLNPLFFASISSLLETRNIIQ